MSQSILAITASAQSENSISRQLVAELIDQLSQKDNVGAIVERDLSDNDTALITAEHIGAFYTPKEERTSDQQAVLEQSDRLVKEVLDANVLIIVQSGVVGR